MSKIELEQISDNEVEVTLSQETPMELVQQLTKSLTARGLVEDLAKSTLSVRYYKKPNDKVNTIADKLIKSLENLTGLSKVRSPMDQARFDQQKRNREFDVAGRRGKEGLKQPTNVSPKPEPLVAPDTPSIKPSGASTLPGVTNKLYDPATSGTVNYKKSEDGEDHVKGCRCEACLNMAKSGYGPKGKSQYNPNDNARRKENNVGDVAGEGPNVNVKSYSSKPGQLSGKASADLTSRIQSKANKQQPVKQWSADEIASENAKRGLKKSWANHLPFPNAEEEMAKVARRNGPPQTAEDLMAQQLANLMGNKAMLGQQPPPQPTDEQMFGAGVVTEDMAKAAEHKWNNTFNNWMVEASKPISQRFRSEAEELAYWESIKVGDRDDGQSGY